MKVLMITDTMRGGGTERRLMESVKGLLTMGYDIKLIVLNTINQYPEIESFGIEIIKVKRKVKKDPGALLTVYNVCRSFRPDIIHSWGTMASVYVVPISKLLHIKFVNGMITTAVCKPFSKRWWRARLTFPFSDQILSNSQAGLEAFRAPANRSTVIHNGFDFNRLNDLIPGEEIRKKFGIQTTFVVGMVAAVDYRKDYHTYVEAARKVLKIIDDVSFLCVGDGLLFETMKDASSDCPNILFLGRQNNIESIMQIMDIGVLTTNSNRCNEGLSNSLVEYMASGLPVIATSGGGTNELVQDGHTGLLIPPFSSEILAEKILFLLQNQNQRIEMGRKGKDRIEYAFNFQKMIKALDSVYRKI